MDIGSVGIRENSEPTQISHMALDIGDSLIKLVYFSTNSASSSSLKGKLHFAKFENTKINDCIDFIQSMQLRLSGRGHPGAPASENCVIKATGGGAYKYADLFKQRLGICLHKKDEFDSLVDGSNFLLKAVHQEAYTYMGGLKEFVQIDHDDLYPFLLVNIGSGVSMIKVDGAGSKYVGRTDFGGGTFWGLGRLLTKCKSFDELLELSHQGNNRLVDMLVRDIYGGMDYTKVGESSTIIASSFGKVISENKEPEDYKPEDISRSLLKLISSNIGQLSYLTAVTYGIKRIFFGGFFIQGHAYTMDTISAAVNFWSNGEAKAMFLRHGGFLGALGAFMSYEKHGFDTLKVHQLVQQSPVGASHGGDKKIHRQPNGELIEKESIICSMYL